MVSERDDESLAAAEATSGSLETMVGAGAVTVGELSSGPPDPYPEVWDVLPFPELLGAATTSSFSFFRQR